MSSNYIILDKPFKKEHAVYRVASIKMNTNKPMHAGLQVNQTMSVIYHYLNPTLQFFIQVYAAEVRLCCTDCYALHGICFVHIRRSILVGYLYHGYMHQLIY